MSTEEALSARLGENVRLLRARIHISQEELGFRADVHRTQISLIESGQRLPRIGTALRLAAALGVEPAILLDGIAYRPRRLTEPGRFEISAGALFDFGAGDRSAGGANR